MPGISVNEVGADTRYCAVFGHPIRHSASPAMQNAGIALLGLNWKYLAFDVPPAQLPDALRGASAMRFVGLNLTVPHKLLALDRMDVLDESARTWGAVNTVRFEARAANRQWVPIGTEPDLPETAEIRSHGFNTDADAIVQSLAEDLGLVLPGAKVFLVGAGGAGRVAALKLASEKVARLWLHNRTEARAIEVAREIERRHSDTRVQIGYPDEDVDVLINATSLGLRAGDPLPFPEEAFDLRRAHAVYDMVYRPAETPLLAAARAGGAQVANGLGMLLHQGARALELWSGRTAPRVEMRRALEANIYGKAFR